ncbi:MFS transporter [Virgibacillus soli]|uniref:MFS transporter n=1 Tax=Paracerasibacillus soli TaxID=480284 RepID=A0ABU5CU36_9BACI|nr:MFS transporter [Virgibacillus soli]MDY0409873.1 MFS transporter [Virgibacillus soli]
MNLKVFILALATIAVGLVELIVGGILPNIATDLGISVSTAGQLITIFALVYAIAGPVLLVLTSKFERKKVYMISLIIFILGNIVTYFSPNFTMIMIARVVTAASTALIVVLSLTIVAKIVEPAYQARALGFIYMGISSSLVLGVPVGILVANAFGWRVLFLGIALLAIGSLILISIFLEPIPGTDSIPLSTQIKALASPKIITAHLATMFFLAGHYTLYAYFTPFLENNLGMSANWISICYFVFGIAAIGGGAFGGALSDRIGSRKSIISVIVAFTIVLALLPFTTFSLLLFIPVMMIWGGLSWSLAPPQQSYLIQTDPVTSDIQQSFNNSALQIGISLGSGIGGIVLNQTVKLEYTAWIGSIVVVLALASAIYSLSQPVTKAKRIRKTMAQSSEI